MQWRSCSKEERYAIDHRKVRVERETGISASEWNMIDAWRATPIWARFGVPASR
jgi:hypothetical protein